MNRSNRFLCPGIFFLILATYPSSLSAQLFTWMKGSDMSSQNGTYGTQGQPAAANTPGARELSMGWTDKNGDLWLFGGNGYPVSGGTGRLNDLWKYDVEEDAWTWVKGPNVVDQTGNYGTKGLSSPSNSPGGRNQSVTWTDTSGVLWLFGGSGYDAAGNLGMLNDLWKYDISSNQWTWISGGNIINAFGTYGAIGLPSAANTPGGRRVAVGWADDQNDLWLFSGDGYAASGSQGYLNDLWRYDITTNQWTWMKGSNAVDMPGVYGTMGTANASNVPGARYAAAAWKDPAGNLWLFNGNGYPASGSAGRLNDLWKYDISSNQWTWMKGNNIINLAGNYGTQGVGNGTNLPGCRYVSAVFGDGSANMWMFGGLGYSTSTTQGRMHDLWRYNSNTNFWTWMKGSNSLNLNGIYGNMRITSAAGIPGARNGAVYWTDHYGRLWVFGGSGFASTGGSSYLNDLWRINCTSPPKKVSSTVTVCQGGDAQLEAFGPGTFSWYNAPVGGNHLGNGNTMTVSGITANAVYYVMDSGCGNNGPRAAVNINVLDSVDVSVSVNGNLLSSNNTAATAYQWLDCNNGFSKIGGAVGRYFTAPGGGSYAVVVSMGDCSDTSACVVLTTGMGDKSANPGVKVYPNPSSGSIYIEAASLQRITLKDMRGQEVYRELFYDSGQSKYALKNLPDGIYVMEIQTARSVFLQKIIVSQN